MWNTAFSRWCLQEKLRKWCQQRNYGSWWDCKPDQSKETFFVTSFHYFQHFLFVSEIYNQRLAFYIIHWHWGRVSSSKLGFLYVLIQRDTQLSKQINYTIEARVIISLKSVINLFLSTSAKISNKLWFSRENVVFAFVFSFVFRYFLLIFLIADLDRVHIICRIKHMSHPKLFFLHLEIGWDFFHRHDWLIDSFILMPRRRWESFKSNPGQRQLV